MPSITDVSYTDITDENKEVQIDLKVLSEKKNCTMAQLSIAWMLKKRIYCAYPGKQKIRTFRRKF